MNRNTYKNIFPVLTIQKGFIRSFASIPISKYKDKDGNEVKPKLKLVASFKNKV